MNAAPRIETSQATEAAPYLSVRDIHRKRGKFGWKP